MKIISKLNVRYNNSENNSCMNNFEMNKTNVVRFSWASCNDFSSSFQDEDDFLT